MVCWYRAVLPRVAPGRVEVADRGDRHASELSGLRHLAAGAEDLDVISDPRRRPADGFRGADQ